jgi:hypothetical protein
MEAGAPGRSGSWLARTSPVAALIVIQDGVAGDGASVDFVRDRAPKAELPKRFRIRKPLTTTRETPHHRLRHRKLRPIVPPRLPASDPIIQILHCPLTGFRRDLPRSSIDGQRGTSSPPQSLLIVIPRCQGLTNSPEVATFSTELQEPQAGTRKCRPVTVEPVEFHPVGSASVTRLATRSVLAVRPGQLDPVRRAVEKLPQDSLNPMSRGAEMVELFEKCVRPPVPVPEPSPKLLQRHP